MRIKSFTILFAHLAKNKAIGSDVQPVERAPRTTGSNNGARAQPPLPGNYDLVTVAGLECTRKCTLIFVVNRQWDGDLKKT